MCICDPIENVLLNMILIMILITENKRWVATVAYPAAPPQLFPLVDIAFVVVSLLDALQIGHSAHHKMSLRHSRGSLFPNRESCGSSSPVASQTL